MQAETQATRLFYPSVLKKQILEALAEYFCLTVRDLVSLLHNQPTEARAASMRRCLGSLDRDSFVNRIAYRPADYGGTGSLPLVCGLSEQGVEWALEHCSWTDPKVLRLDHSPLTLEHELKRARFHRAIVTFCQTTKLELFWKKTNLYHTVDPDDVFAVRGPRGIRYCFFELENRRKSFKELLAKYARYDEYYDTDQCRKEWKDFRTFTVITQMRSDESRFNFVRFLAGEPASFNGKWVINSSPVRNDAFWFSTEEQPLAFISPPDFERRQHSFHDLA